MRSAIVNRLKDAMNEQGVDALVCLSPENFAYVAGCVVPSLPLMRWRHAAAIVTVDGRCAYLVVDMEESTVRMQADGIDVHTWGEFTHKPMKVLSDVLSDLGLASGKIGTEMSYLPAGDYAELKSHLPDSEIVHCEDTLARSRRIKTADEIELMRRLSRIADESIHNSLMEVGSGSSEMDIAGGLTRNIYNLGADEFKLMIVATGERSVYPNVGPSLRKLQDRDICRVEIFAVINGYHAGVCRTAYVNSAPGHAEEIWKNLVECKYQLFEMMKPGESTRAIYEAFVGTLKKLNLPPIKFAGHGIGVHLHEEPYLGMYADEPLEEGMVFGVEPLVYDTGYGFGMQNKDIVLVTETGSDLLSDFTNTDTLFAIN